MSLYEYLKDKTIYLLSMAVITILTVTILWALNPVGGPPLSFLIGGMYLIGGTIPLALEYIQKKHFYQNLLAIFDSLDRKNIIAEMVAAPSFREGIILYDLLRGCNKAMLEEINKYRFRQEEYREYMELWVHEIKTPISSSRLIAHNNESEAMISLTEELTKIEAFVEQVLFYSRSNNVEKDYIIRSINLKALCHEVIRKNAKLFIHHHIRVDTQNLDFQVFSDAKWLEFILFQILTNAVKYRDKPDAWIKLFACRTENAVVLNISDNGCGIHADELCRIFDKGYTGTNGRKNERSTGMGLYIGRKLCNKLGHGLEARSISGEGTTLSIIFPISSMTNIL